MRPGDREETEVPPHEVLVVQRSVSGCVTVVASEGIVVGYENRWEFRPYQYDYLRAWFFVLRYNLLTLSDIDSSRPRCD